MGEERMAVEVQLLLVEMTPVVVRSAMARTSPLAASAAGEAELAQVQCRMSVAGKESTCRRQRTSTWAVEVISTLFAHVATHAAAYATTHPAAHTAACASRASRSVQLRGGCREHLGSRQEGVVLPHPPPWMPTHGAAALRASVAASGANSTSPSR